MQIVIPNEMAFRELYDPSRALFFLGRLIDSSMFPAPIWVSREGKPKEHINTYLCSCLRFETPQMLLGGYFKKIFRAYELYASGALVQSSPEEGPRKLKTTPLKTQEILRSVKNIREDARRYQAKEYNQEANLCMKLASCLEELTKAMVKVPIGPRTKEELYPKVLALEKSIWEETYGETVRREARKCTWPPTQERGDEEIAIACKYLVKRLRPSLKNFGQDTLVRLVREDRLDELCEEMVRKDAELITVSLETGLPILTRDAGIAKFAPRWNFNGHHQYPELKVVFSAFDPSCAGFRVYYNCRKSLREESYPNTIRQFKV